LPATIFTARRHQSGTPGTRVAESREVDEGPGADFAAPANLFQENKMLNDPLVTTAETDSGAHRDPLSGEVGAHPLGVGLGAAAGGMAIGAAVGTVAGPFGTALGAIAGAIAGGLVGKGAAEIIDPTAADAYWRGQYAARAYAPRNDDRWEGAPVHGYGLHHYNRNVGRGVDAMEDAMDALWDTARDGLSPPAGGAHAASGDAWDRMMLRAMRGAE